MWSSSPFRFAGGAPPQTPLQHYQETCESLKKSAIKSGKIAKNASAKGLHEKAANAARDSEEKWDALNDFILRTADPINQFRQKTLQSCPKIVMKYEGWGSKVRVDDKSHIRAAALHYFNAADVPILVRQQYLSYLDINIPMANQQTGQLETLQSLLKTLTCCDEPDPHMLGEYAVCSECGTKVDGSECFMANFADMHSSPNKCMQIEEPAAASSADADNAVHSAPPRLTWSSIIGKTRTIVQMISTIQGHKVHPFDMSKWQLYVEKNIVPLSLSQRKQLTHQHVWEDLRKQGATEQSFKDLYKNTPTIWSGITGKELHHIPEGCIWVILNVIMPRLIQFTQTGTNDRRDTKWDLQRSGRQHEHSTPNTKGTVIRNTVIVLRKCMELCGEKDFQHLIIGQNGEPQRLRINDLWRAFCTHNEWQM